MNKGREYVIMSASDDIETEARRAMRLYPRPFNSPHEGYAVMLEEVEELWEAVRSNDLAQMRKEAVQVGAMAIRFLVEVSQDKVNGDKR